MGVFSSYMCIVGHDCFKQSYIVYDFKHLFYFIIFFSGNGTMLHLWEICQPWEVLFKLNGGQTLKGCHHPCSLFCSIVYFVQSCLCVYCKYVGHVFKMKN
jgi:hypothetical protein